jgi:hypothetical protein
MFRALAFQSILFHDLQIAMAFINDREFMEPLMSYLARDCRRKSEDGAQDMTDLLTLMNKRQGKS